MPGLNLLPFFMVGLLGSVHCIGMCGGIVSAFSLAGRPARPFPVAVVLQGPPLASAGVADAALRALAYNGGRIASYATAGALAGGLAGGARALAGAANLQLAGYWLANLMLVALGLSLMDAWRGLARLEALGQVLWRRLEPLTRTLVPVDHPLKLLALGALWGWLPCGMVYSVLVAAMLSGSAGSGAAVMLAFGLGTLPALLGIGMLGARLRGWTRRAPVRVACGLVVAGFGVLGLARAAGAMPLPWLDALCLAPAAAGMAP